MSDLDTALDDNMRLRLTIAELKAANERLMDKLNAMTEAHSAIEAVSEKRIRELRAEREEIVALLREECDIPAGTRDDIAVQVALAEARRRGYLASKYERECQKLRGRLCAALKGKP